MGIVAEEVNEYATSLADLVIRRDEGNLPVALAVVSLDIPKVEETLTGTVAELKLDNAGNLPFWEYFRNMSATGTAISMEHLTRGVIVNKVTIYGIVVRIRELEHTKLLRLDMDFEAGECKFVKCRKEFNFDLLLNVVVSAL